MSVVVNLGHRILANSLCYNSFQNAVGAVKFRKELVSKVLGSSEMKNVVDIGCGTGATIPLLIPTQRYLGLDISERYLKKAEKIESGNDIELNLCDLGSPGWGAKLSLYPTPIILAMGIFHHLDDSTLENTLVELQTNAEVGMILHSVDPIVTLQSSTVASWFARNDRGKYIRDEIELRNLFSNFGWKTSFTISKNRLRIPYDTIECHGEYVG